MKRKTLVSIIILVVIVALGLIAHRYSKPNTLQTETETPSLANVDGVEKVRDGTYTVVPESVINWQGQKTIAKDWVDTGTIAMKEGTIVAKDGNATGTLVFDMDTISATTTGKGDGQSGLVRHLKSDAFFDVTKYPTATFKLKNLTADESDETGFVYNATGDLTIKGTTHEIAFPVTFFMANNTAFAQGKMTFDRTKWDIRFGSQKFFDNLGDNVIDDMITLSFVVSAR